MVKKCSHCGSENDDGCIFCYECGIEIGENKSESIDEYSVSFRPIVISAVVIAIIMFAMVALNYDNSSQDVGQFTLIAQELSVKYREVTPNSTISIYADFLSVLTNYFINVSEWSNITCLSWFVYAFGSYDNYNFDYKISAGFINCTALGIELWSYDDWYNDFFLLDSIFIQV